MELHVVDGVDVGCFLDIGSGAMAPRSEVDAVKSETEKIVPR